MRTEIKKYHLRVNTVSEFSYNVTGILRCLDTLLFPTLDASQKSKEHMGTNCIHKALVWFILLLSAGGALGLALAYLVDMLGCGCKLAS